MLIPCVGLTCNSSYSKSFRHWFWAERIGNRRSSTSIRPEKQISTGPGCPTYKIWYFFVKYSYISGNRGIFQSPCVFRFALFSFLWFLLLLMAIYQKQWPRWKSKSLQKHFQDYLFWYTTINILSGHYLRRYGPLIFHGVIQMCIPSKF